MSVLERYGCDDRRRKEAEKSPKYTLGRILTQSKRSYRLVTEKGEYLGEVSGKFRHGATGLQDFPAVGDFVLVTASSSTGKAVIHQLLERRTSFERTIAGNAPRIQVIATNVDVAFLCMSLNANYNLNRLERYLSVAWKSGARPIVVLTKADLIENADAILEDVKGIARNADILLTRTDDSESCLALRRYLGQGRTAVFIGSSGVGKSTLVNLLAGEELQETGEIRETDDKGRHTTSMREMILLPSGGVVIDTPGMRELGIDTADLESSFDDIEELALECRFSDCRHVSEPDCAVRKAVEEGRLDERRLESYIKLRYETTGR